MFPVFVLPVYPVCTPLSPSASGMGATGTVLIDIRLG